MGLQENASNAGKKATTAMVGNIFDRTDDLRRSLTRMGQLVLRLTLQRIR